MANKKRSNSLLYIFWLVSLVVLVFYLGYFFGYRERVNNSPDNLSLNNPNALTINNITDLNSLDVIGTTDSRTKRVFGQMFYIVNANNQTEILIKLNNVPLKVTQSVGNLEVLIPSKLQVDFAIRTTDAQGRQYYEYKNITMDESQPAVLAFDPVINGVRSASYSYTIDGLLYQGGDRLDYERIVLRPLDEEQDRYKNVYIDPDPDLPLLVGGNEAAGIPGEPAPFFWIKLSE